MGSRLRCLLFSCLALAGCGAGLSGRSRHVSEERVSVTLRVLDENVRVVVPGRLGATPVEWMLDTGASWHAIDTGDARERELLEPVAPGATIWVDVTVPLTVSVFRGGTAVGSLGVVTDHEDVVGVLSPQRLAGDGAVELDLPRGELSRLEPDVARAASDEVALRGARLGSCSDEAGRSVPVVTASVEGVTVRLVVDTGSPFTVLFADTEAGAIASLRTSSRYDLDDWAFDSDLAIVPDVPISVAGVTTTERVGILGRPSALPSSCEVDGLLGLDILRGCTLILHEGILQGAIPHAIPHDAGEGQDAMACERASPLDTAPALTRLTPVAPPTPLAERAPALSPGVAATIGCASVTEAELASELPGSPTANEREAYLRARALQRFAAEIHAEGSVSEADVDRAIEGVRARFGPEAFEAGLVAENMTLDAYRAAIRTQLIELRVAAWMSLDRDELAMRLRDRYARVATVGAGARCFESWPAYYLEEVVLVGLAPADERALRLSLARRLRGAALSLGAPGVLPGMWRDAVEEVFAPRDLAFQYAILSEGPTLEIRVTLAPSPD